MNKSFYVETTELCYRETDMSELERGPCRFGCDIQIVCVGGYGTISTGIQSYEMRMGTELFLLGGALVKAQDLSPDFRVCILMYPKDVVMKAILPLSTDFLNYIHEFPYFDHLCQEAEPGEWDYVRQWMDMAKTLFSSPVPHFRKQLEQNFLQSLLMCIFNNMPQTVIRNGYQYSRRKMLCHQFVRLIRENSSEEHQVPFYARQLGISSRYLGDLVAENFGGKTAKRLIDEQLVAEIKAQLDNPQLSVFEIAEYFNFPEHTCLSRFFKRITGMSPKEYRQMRK